MAKSPSKSSSNRRQGFLINPKFQWDFIRRCLLLAACVLGVIFAANTYFFWSLKRTGLDAGLSADHIFFRFLAHQENRMFYISLGTSALVSIVILVFGLRLSHRIAGPLHKLNRFLRNAKDKNAVLKFRERDFFPELAASATEALQETSRESESQRRHG